MRPGGSCHGRSHALRTMSTAKGPSSLRQKNSDVAEEQKEHDEEGRSNRQQTNQAGEEDECLKSAKRVGSPSPVGWFKRLL
eukprot:2599629-Pleurochrysis_carterae.AAC.3